MTKHAKLGLLLLVVVCVVVIAVVVSRITPTDTVRYGISPFQDTAMPKASEGMGLYEKNGLDVELVTVDWEKITATVASGGESVDVAIGSINTFLPRAENINVEGGGDVVFYYPLYVFKGASLMMHADSGIEPLSVFLERYPDDRDRAVKEAVEQLRGKTIGLSPASRSGFPLGAGSFLRSVA